MGSKVTFVDNSDSFIVRSIIKELEGAGIECQSARYLIKDIEEKKEEFGPVLIEYIDNPDIDNSALVFLRDICLEKNIDVFLIGKKEDVEEIRKNNRINNVAGEFYRPVNVKEVAEKLTSYGAEDKASSRYHVLVVDDSGVMLNTIQEWLGKKYRVSVVNSAMNAINFLEKSIPDVILLDYEMPGCSGPQLLEMLRADLRTEQIPVIFLTGKDDKESVKRVLNLNPAGYLLKNMPKEYIISQIDAFFDKLKAQSL